MVSSTDICSFTSIIATNLNRRQVRSTGGLNAHPPVPVPTMISKYLHGLVSRSPLLVLETLFMSSRKTMSCDAVRGPPSSKGVISIRVLSSCWMHTEDEEPEAGPVSHEGWED